MDKADEADLIVILGLLITTLLVCLLFTIGLFVLNQLYRHLTAPTTEVKLPILLFEGEEILTMSD